MGDKMRYEVLNGVSKRSLSAKYFRESIKAD